MISARFISTIFAVVTAAAQPSGTHARKEEE
jgi:hypothetical protein